MARIKRDYKKVRIVLQAAKQDLELSGSYVDRIVALQNSARILELLTDYQKLAEDIQRHLAIADNFDSREISAYSQKIISCLAKQIQHLGKVEQHIPPAQH